MKPKHTSRYGAALYIALALGSIAQAEFINGVILFAGLATFDDDVLANAKQVVSWGSPTVLAVTDDLDTYINAGDSVEFVEPWIFVPNTPESSFWSVKGFTFNLMSSYVDTPVTDDLHITGTGLITGNGFDETPGTWSFTAQEPSIGAIFSFSASSEAVPDGGTTLVLLGLSLLGLNGLRRKFDKR